MPAPITLAQGQVLRAFYPFTEMDGGKVRPCVVLGWRVYAQPRDVRVLLVPVSTFGGGATPTVDDVLLDGETQSGLEAGSFLRTCHFGTLSLSAMTPTRLIGRVRPPIVSQALAGVQKLVLPDKLQAPSVKSA